MGFMEQLSHLMQRNRTSVAELSRGIGVSRQAIMGWLKGSVPSMDKIQKVAEFYNLPLDYFGESTTRNSFDGVLVPILGRIRAGYPVESFDSPEGFVHLFTVSSSNNLFALVVAGDSMMPLVMDGDTIILDRNIENANGRICAVTIDNESTLKRVRLDSTGVTLIPTNPMYPELHLSPKKAEESGFRIDGVLVQMIREF